MILREIKNIFIKNRLTEGVDYKRYEWLKYMNWAKPKGENSLLGAYLNCNLKVTTRLKVTIKLGEIIRMNNSDVELIVRSSTRTYYIRRSYFNNNIAVYSPPSTMISNEYNLGSNLDFLITEEGLFVNDVRLINKKIEYINQFGQFGRSCTGSISSVTTEEGVDILVPCQLLKSIPATLDANNIARSAGECGMYDSISGKFYGNVASSGTFTVEGDVEPETHTGLQQIYQNKLIEGVDYDVYTYLKGTGGCYIDTLINPAWNDQLSATTKVSRRPTVPNPVLLKAEGANIYIGIILGGNWYKNGIPQILAIQRVSNTDDYIVYQSFPASAEIYMSLKVTNNAVPITSCKIDGASWTNVDKKGTNIITELPNATYKIGRDTQNGLDVLKLKNVKINLHNFVPCKLKCAIPRNLDAQCKERVAGECGMIDLISGKFYGNVASSGTFTVENDNNE